MANAKEKIGKMVDAIADGDLSAAGYAFDAAVKAKRDEALETAKVDFADKVFDEDGEEESEEEVSDDGAESEEGNDDDGGTPTAPVNPHMGR